MAETQRNIIRIYFTLDNHDSKYDNHYNEKLCCYILVLSHPTKKVFHDKSVLGTTGYLQYLLQSLRVTEQMNPLEGAIDRDFNCQIFDSTISQFITITFKCII